MNGSPQIPPPSVMGLTPNALQRISGGTIDSRHADPRTRLTSRPSGGVINGISPEKRRMARRAAALLACRWRRVLLVASFRAAAACLIEPIFP